MRKCRYEEKTERSNRNIYVTGKNCISVGIIEVKWCGLSEAT
jgi:hypothetical protein